MKISYTLLYSIILSIFSVHLTAQNTSPKILQAVRADKSPKIDGKNNDIAWQKANIATDFVMFKPGDGDPIPQSYNTTVKIVYDDAGIYILAQMKDPNPSGIRREFGLRDQMVQADYFAVLLNPFSTPNNTFTFTVFASGAQADGIQKTRNLDWSWNAVWKSAVSITDDGWQVEMRIPYAALRFQNKDNQTWSLGFVRHIDQKREDYSWTYIDKTKNGDMVQFLGKLTDLKHLKPPVRLSLYPYTSAVHTRFEGNKNTDFGFGLDLKYGLSESYTLDATLIPDFSDTPYDNLELNLGPFEQHYKENRQFFTEGVDLFNKGHLFYSRRVGSFPIDYGRPYSELQNNETVVENPTKTQLINAVKISGRSNNGLGLGFFNAITNRSYASLKNTQTGEERTVLTAPLTNYNIVVADYNFSGNSSVSFINTNVTRQGNYRDANVSALVFDLYGQDNTLSLLGSVAMSYLNQLNDNPDSKDYSGTGYRMYMRSSKKIKNHTFSAIVRAQDDKFDNNDLGFNRTNNYAKFDVAYSYKILKPTKHFNSLFISFDVGFDRRYKPFTKIQNDFELNLFATNKKYFSFGSGLEYVTDAHDYYEPRVPGRFYLDKAHGGIWAFVSTDYRKKMAVDIKTAYFSKIDGNQNYKSIKISPRFRFNNRFKVQYSFDYSIMNNGKGFVDIENNNIIFGNRKQKTVTNTLGANYYFNTRSGVNLNFRYYWAPVQYDRFYTLEENGELTDNNTYNQNKDINFNIWNFDLGYSWEFAPGSKMSLLYRHAISNQDQLSQLTFSENFNNLMQQNQRHTFIAKITYYIDYNTVKNKWF